MSHDHSYAVKINRVCLGEIKIQTVNVILPLPRTLGLVSVAPSCPVGEEVSGTRTTFKFITLAVVIAPNISNLILLDANLILNLINGENLRSEHNN